VDAVLESDKATVLVLEESLSNLAGLSVALTVIFSDYPRYFQKNSQKIC
jgi:hypothetical protein